MEKIEYLLPTRIVLQQRTVNERRLLENRVRQAILADVQTTTIKAGGYIVLDFSKELQGGIHYTVQSNSIREPMHMRVTFGESVSESMSSIGEKNATNHHAPRDVTVEVSRLSSQRIGNTGFRFVKIEAIGQDIELASVLAVSEYANLTVRGAFECSDPLLNRIWETSAYTVHLNIHEYIWDGIKRDRLVWIGDMHPEVSTIAAVFGRIDSVERSLDLIRDHTPSGKWMNDIPSYTMWWIIIHRDWYLHTGNLRYLSEQKQYLTQAVQMLFAMVCEDGSCNADNTFVDWSSNTTAESKIGFQGLIAMAFAAARDIFLWLGDREMGEKCLTFRMKTAGYIPEGFSGNKQVMALAALGGVYDLQEAADRIAKDGARGFSTFLGFYNLRTLAQAGKIQEAFDIIKEYWGAMLQLGATSFWEDFDLEWMENAARIDEPVPKGKRDIHGDFGRFCYEGFRHSLCHGWAGGPAAFLSETVLGIVPLEAGFKKIKIRPNLGNLEWAAGKYPTPYGDISVSYRKVNGELRKEIQAPKDVDIYAP